jgi:hypothetical protein
MGERVRVFDNFSSGKRENLRSVIDLMSLLRKE